MDMASVVAWIANLPSSDSVSVFFLSPPRRQREGVGGLDRDDWLVGEGQHYYVDLYVLESFSSQWVWSYALRLLSDCTR
jgi:hypothetical protein